MFLFNSVGSFAASANYYEVKIAGKVAGYSNSREKAGEIIKFMTAAHALLMKEERRRAAAGELITGEIKYDGIVGGKTGYTDLARETLVTCAEKNGMKDIL